MLMNRLETKDAGECAVTANLANEDETVCVA